MKKRQQIQLTSNLGESGFSKATTTNNVAYNKSENIYFEEASGKDLVELITSQLTRTEDEWVIANPVEVK